MNEKSTILEMMELSERFSVNAMSVFSFVTGGIIPFIIIGMRDENVQTGKYKMLISETKQMIDLYKKTKDPQLSRKIMDNLKKLKKVVKTLIKISDDPKYKLKGEKILKELETKFSTIMNENYSINSGLAGDIGTFYAGGLIGLIYRLKTKVPYTIGKVEKIEAELNTLKERYKSYKDPEIARKIMKIQEDLRKYVILIIKKIKDPQLRREYEDKLKKIVNKK